MRNYKLTVAYDGTAYSGWQLQPDKPTIQGALEAGLWRLAGRLVRVTASSRTDAGVHALGQVVGFSADLRLALRELPKALNANTPDDILVREACEVPTTFHATRDARSKRYRYLIHDHPQPDVFCRNYAWHVRQALDDSAMAQAASRLVGRHDFASFQTAGSERVSTVRTVSQLVVCRQGHEPLGPLAARRLVVEIEADGFLYNMVRNIVGTLVEIGRGKQPAQWMQDVLLARDRRQAGMTAPPQGLYLMHVRYDGDGAGGDPAERGVD